MGRIVTQTIVGIEGAQYRFKNKPPKKREGNNEKAVGSDQTTFAESLSSLAERIEVRQAAAIRAGKTERNRRSKEKKKVAKDARIQRRKNR